MDCEFLERVSMLVDGELGGEEGERVRRHVEACAVCRHAEREFLLVREQLRSYRPEPDQQRASRALRAITGEKSFSWWSKKITLPAPAFALAVLLVLAAVVWPLVRPARVVVIDDRAIKLTESDRPAEGQPDFSRFDHGERALIYKARRTNAGILEQ